MKIRVLHRRVALNIVEFLCDPPKTHSGWSLHRAA